MSNHEPMDIHPCLSELRSPSNLRAQSSKKKTRLKSKPSYHYSFASALPPLLNPNPPSIHPSLFGVPPSGRFSPSQAPRSTATGAGELPSLALSSPGDDSRAVSQQHHHHHHLNAIAAGHAQKSQVSVVDPSSVSLLPLPNTANSACRPPPPPSASTCPVRPSPALGSHPVSPQVDEMRYIHPIHVHIPH